MSDPRGNAAQLKAVDELKTRSKELNDAIGSIAELYSTSFNTSLKNFNTISTTIQTVDDCVSRIRSNLHEAADRLSSRIDYVQELANQRDNFKSSASTIREVQKLQGLPVTIKAALKAQDYLSAADGLKAVRVALEDPLLATLGPVRPVLAKVELLKEKTIASIVTELRAAIFSGAETHPAASDPPAPRKAPGHVRGASGTSIMMTQMLPARDAGPQTPRMTSLQAKAVGAAVVAGTPVAMPEYISALVFAVQTVDPSSDGMAAFVKATTDNLIATTRAVPLVAIKSLPPAATTAAVLDVLFATCRAMLAHVAVFGAACGDLGADVGPSFGRAVSMTALPWLQDILGESSTTRPDQIFRFTGPLRGGLGGVDTGSSGEAIAMFRAIEPGPDNVVAIHDAVQRFVRAVHSSPGTEAAPLDRLEQYVDGYTRETFVPMITGRVTRTVARLLAAPHAFDPSTMVTVRGRGRGKRGAGVQVVSIAPALCDELEVLASACSRLAPCRPVLLKALDDILDQTIDAIQTRLTSTTAGSAVEAMLKSDVYRDVIQGNPWLQWLWDRHQAPDVGDDRILAVQLGSIEPDLVQSALTKPALRTEAVEAVIALLDAVQHILDYLCGRDHARGTSDSTRSTSRPSRVRLVHEIPLHTERLRALRARCCSLIIVEIRLRTYRPFARKGPADAKVAPATALIRELQALHDTVPVAPPLLHVVFQDVPALVCDLFFGSLTRMSTVPQGVAAGMAENLRLVQDVMVDIVGDASRHNHTAPAYHFDGLKRFLALYAVAEDKLVQHLEAAARATDANVMNLARLKAFLVHRRISDNEDVRKLIFPIVQER